MRPRLKCAHSLRPQRIRSLALASLGGGFEPGAPGGYASNLLWLAADRNVTTSGADLLSWVDPANSSNIASRSAVGAECTLEMNVRNGLPAVRLDNRYLNLSCPALSTWSGSGHAFFVAAGLPAADYLYFLHSAANACVYVSNRFYWDDGSQLYGGSLGWGYGDPLFDSTYRSAWAIWEMKWDAGPPSYYRNGGGPMSTGGVNLPLSNSNFNRSGGGPDLMGGLDGDYYLGEMALFNAPVTGSDRSDILGYLTDKWDL